MESLSEFLDMGGYAAFVWPCFGITTLVLVVLLIVSIRQTKAREAELDALQRADREARSRA